MKKNLRSFFWILAAFLLFPEVSLAQISVGTRDWGFSIGGGGISAGGTNWGGSIGSVSGAGGMGSFSPVNPGLPSGSIMGIVYNLLMWLLAMMGILAILGFVLSGVFYLTAAGDGETIKKAKSIATNSAIGIIVGLSGYIITQAIFRMLSATGTAF